MNPTPSPDPLTDSSPSRPRQAGLVILGVLSFGDLTTPALTDGKTPPWAVAILAAVLGAVSLWLVVRAWREPARAVRLLIGLRILSAASSLPAFLVHGVPFAAQVLAAILVVLTAVGVLLVGRTQARVTLPA